MPEMRVTPIYKKRLMYAALVFIVLCIGILHAVTPGHLFFYHDTFRRLSYFPITLGALWFGVRGGASLALLTSAAFIPHLMMFWNQGPAAYYSELTEIIFYLSAGIVVGIISSRESRLRERYRNLSRELRKSYDRLRDQARQLVETQEQLSQSQKLSALGHLSASLAHEIKNPLASIRGTAEILLDDFPEAHPKHEFITIMLSEISRLNNSVEDVLDYCRGQQRTVKSHPETPSRVITRVAALMEQQFKDKAVKLRISGREETDTFTTDGAKLSQIIINILLNAIDAVDTGGEITICSSRDGSGETITICDNGPGIDPGKREHIFEPFVTGKPHGTGLGLYISSKLIRSLGGSITVSEAPGGGSCFALSLPDNGTSPMGGA